MPREQTFAGRTLSVLTVVAIVAIAFWFTPSRPISSAQDREQANRQPLIARGYTDATNGTFVIAGDPRGGQTVVELRVKEGQKVKRGEIIAVLTGYPRADIMVRIAEADLLKIKEQREAMLTGPRVSQIAIAEAAIKSTIDGNKLSELERSRSPKPPDQRELEADIAERGLAHQKADLDLQKRQLKNDLALSEIDLANAEARLENARTDREASLVRSPVDGIVTEIYTRQGEAIPGRLGIAKIVDMHLLRVVADIDELHLNRLVPGARVEVTFRGSSRVYPGKVVRAPMTVTRLKRSNADLGMTSAHLVEAEIEFDDPTSIPQMLEREARITFL
jgi:HlyD family secretion protein